MHILDDIVDEMLRKVFSHMRALSKTEALESQFKEKVSQKQALLQKAKKEFTQAQQELDVLKKEVLKAIQGESDFPAKLLSEMIPQSEANCILARDRFTVAQKENENERLVWKTIEHNYQELITWSQLYDAAGIAEKKMIAASLIEWVDVFRGYKVRIKFSISVEQRRAVFKRFGLRQPKINQNHA